MRDCACARLDFFKITVIAVACVMSGQGRDITQTLFQFRAKKINSNLSPKDKKSKKQHYIDLMQFNKKNIQLTSQIMNSA